VTSEPASLEGWEPRVGDEASLDDVIDRAFDYRGDVTVVLADDVEHVGYLFNRDREATEPVVQMFLRDREDPVTFPYAAIRAIKFTGKDTAAGKSYAAWLRVREAARSSRGA
jgi:hypothetical protein